MSHLKTPILAIAEDTNMGAVGKDQILGMQAEDYMTPEAVDLVARAKAMAPRLAEP